jgi:hypothetical protein
MNPSYLMLRRSAADAMARYGAWIGVPELAPPLEVAEDDAIDLALQDEEWKGLAVYIFVSGPWTVFEELSGGLADRPVEEWVRLADGGDLVYAGYNDAIGYGEFVRVERGQIMRQFLEDEQEPGADVNVGKLPGEAVQPLTHWTDVARWVDEEEDRLTGREKGWLWIHQVP